MGSRPSRRKPLYQAAFRLSTQSGQVAYDRPAMNGVDSESVARRLRPPGLALVVPAAALLLGIAEIILYKKSGECSAGSGVVGRWCGTLTLLHFALSSREGPFTAEIP